MPPIVRHLFRQFSFWQALRLLFAEAIYRWLDDGNRVSYSSNGEDAALEALLKPSAQPFYVDVGCNQPDRYSNTFALYRRGWRGICIDANERLIARHRALRIRDQQVLAAVSDEEVDVVFTIYDHCDLISSMNSSVTDTLKDRVDARTVKMRTRTLTDILDELHAPADFELLSIDVEGQDFSVIKSLNWQRYRPQIVVVEILGFDIDTAQQSEICQWLRQKGYKFIGYLVFNAYFLRDSDTPNPVPILI